MMLVPTLNEEGEMENGHYIEALAFCMQNCNKGKCKSFYTELKKEPLSSRFVTCPYGMSVYVSALDKQIYCSMREKNTYQKKQAKNISGVLQTYNPVLPAEQLQKLIQASQIIAMGRKDLDQERAVVAAISHEAKKLNGQIMEHSDLAMNLLKGEAEVHVPNDQETRFLFEELRTIYLSSSMISSRYSLYDYERNPCVLKGGRADCDISKKFVDISRIFYNYQKRAIPIKTDGKTRMYASTFNSFELVPLLLIENAAKYAHSGSEVTIRFEEPSENALDVTIESESPYCSQDDLNQIFNKGFRGKNAIRVADGTGIGLYFVKEICDLHDIDISINSENSKITTYNGIAYAPFVITLHFKNTYKLE